MTCRSVDAVEFDEWSSAPNCLEQRLPRGDLRAVAGGGSAGSTSAATTRWQRRSRARLGPRVLPCRPPTLAPLMRLIGGSRVWFSTASGRHPRWEEAHRNPPAGLVERAPRGALAFVCPSQPGERAAGGRPSITSDRPGRFTLRAARLPEHRASVVRGRRACSIRSRLAGGGNPPRRHQPGRPRRPAVYEYAASSVSSGSPPGARVVFERYADLVGCGRRGRPLRATFRSWLRRDGARAVTDQRAAPALCWMFSPVSARRGRRCAAACSVHKQEVPEGGYEGIVAVGETLLQLLKGGRAPVRSGSSAAPSPASSSRARCHGAAAAHAAPAPVTPASAARSPTARGPPARCCAPVANVELHYLLAAWVATASDQHVLLDWAVHAATSYQPPRRCSTATARRPSSSKTSRWRSSHLTRSPSRTREHLGGE